jgi:SAM-dependent methyltransferase
MARMEWRDLAGWYSAKQGEEGDPWHRTFLDPTLFAALGEVAGLRVLDLACGNGHNTRRLARLGARVTGVDLSDGLIAASRAREEREPLGIAYHVADAAHLEMLADGAFDLVACQMALMDIPDAAGAIREAGRVLRAGGRFVALLCHPCFDVPESSGWAYERMGPEAIVWRKVRRYAEPGEGLVYWRVDGELVYVTAYHRPLSWYVRALRAAGMVLTALEEPPPPDAFMAHEPELGVWMRDVPMHLVIEARRIALPE